MIYCVEIVKTSAVIDKYVNNLFKILIGIIIAVTVNVENLKSKVELKKNNAKLVRTRCATH